MYTSHPGNLFHEPLKARPFESTNDEFVFDQTRNQRIEAWWGVLKNSVPTGGFSKNLRDDAGF